jgi:hypothetical protein
MSETMVEAGVAERVVRRDEVWPELPLEAWADTYATLQRRMRIAGKILLKRGASDEPVSPLCARLS